MMFTVHILRPDLCHPSFLYYLLLDIALVLLTGINPSMVWSIGMFIYSFGGETQSFSQCKQSGARPEVLADNQKIDQLQSPG